MRTRPRFLMAMAAFGLVARATTAEAYTVETVVTPGCHEAITMNALRAARVATSAAAPLPLVTSDDAAMAADLPYTPASDMQDLGAIALVLGVRSVDLQGASFDALDQIAIIQGDPTTQDQHCLRNGGDVEPNGTLEAIGQCRAFIVGQVAAALAYLGPDGAPSASLRTGLDVSLSIRGEVTVPLPGFYVNMGQALHALEDSFAHTFRADAAGPITASLNFLELTTGDVDQAVDGPPHRTGLDVCQGLDPERQAKLTAAESAATSILVAALSRGTNDERMANVDAVLDTYLAYKPGCTAANSWCDAPEQAYEETPSCSIGWGRSRSAWA